MTTYFDNPFKDDAAIYGPVQKAALNPADAEAARKSLRTWSVYEATPLLNADQLANRLGVGKVWIKDEAQRKPLKSFKSLGGAYALMVALSQRIAVKTGSAPDPSQLASGEYDTHLSKQRVVATTDGNHGRSLAWGASLFRIPCTIYVPRGVSESRKDAIRAFGADVITIDGNYDETLAQCEALAKENGWIHIQDTSHEDHAGWHRVIMEGYTLMVEEILEALPAGERPTHMFLQVGCGGMAAAMVAHMASQWGPDNLPKTILVQSEAVDPLVQSFATGKIQVDHGAHDTALIGIACGEVATLSQHLLYPFVDGGMTIRDGDAFQLMREAANGELTGKPFVMGETGATGLTAAVVASEDTALRAQLGLDKNSKILVISSEGDTDPEFYQQIVAHSSSACVKNVA